MYSFFVGIDVSKSFVDVAFMQGHKVFYLDQFPNNISGFKLLVKELKRHTDAALSSWFVCFENTGVYSKALLEWLISQGIPCREENALKISRSMGLRRGKDDRIDAQDICRYVFEKRDIIQSSNLPKLLIIKLKKLLSRRDLLVRQKQSLCVTLKDQKNAMDPELYTFLKSGNDILIEEYAKQIMEVEKMIDQLMEEDQEVKTNYTLAKSVIGIGQITAAYMIAFTENFTSFSNGRKFACYGGVAPFPNRSGTKIGRTKVSHMANKKIKSLLSNGVNAAVMYDKEIQMYYQRKLAEGKEKGVVLNAIKNKLIHRVFAVINRQTAYVKIVNYV